MATLLLPLHLTLLVTGAIATIVGVLLAWPRRGQPAGTTLLLLLAAIAEWQLCSALGASAVTLEIKRTWAVVQYAGVVTVAPLWLQFVLRHLGHARGTGARALAALSAVPLLTLAAAVTSAHHGWLWSRIELLPTTDGVRAVFHHGPIFWLVAAYSYALLGVAAALLLPAMRRNRPVMRSQEGILLVAGAAPWVANLLYLSGFINAPGIDPTPIAFGVTGVCAAIALADYGLLELSPSRLWQSRTEPG